MLTKKKEAREEREIKGEVEGYGKDVTPFPGNRGSRGMRVDGAWHNIIGYRDFLEMLDENFPRGSYVSFVESKNKKGFWDTAEGTLHAISKQEAYNKKLPPAAPEPEQKKAPVEEIETPAVAEQNEKIRRAEARMAAEETQRLQAVPRKLIDTEKKEDEFDCKIIETDVRRKERFALISEENWEKVKSHNKLIPNSDNFYITTVLREGEVGFIFQSDGWKLRLILEGYDKEIKDEKKYFEESGQALFEIPRADAIKMFDSFMKDPSLQAIKLTFNPAQNAALQLKATLVITIVSGLGPKIIMEIDKANASATQHLLLLLLAETEIAKEMLKQKIMASKRNVTIEETISKK